MNKEDTCMLMRGRTEREDRAHRHIRVRIVGPAKTDRVNTDRVNTDRVNTDRVNTDRVNTHARNALLQM